jgi:ribonuclease VapC
MSEIVLDSSAVLALLLGEPGHEVVRAALPGSFLSTVNFAEIATKLCERGVPVSEVRNAILTLGIDIVDFTVEHALLTGELRNATKSAGLSIGDRACLALAQLHGLPALTADKAWAGLPGFNIEFIR